MILAGDSGGTKTVLALYDAELTQLREQVFVSARYPSLDAIVAEFMRVLPDAPITAASFGVAGPVSGTTAKITNLPWTIDARAIGAQLGGITVSLMNDLQATALGMLVLPTAAFATLQAGEPSTAPSGATIAVIAPGTGLGEAVLVADERGRYRALPTEAGHADFAPGTDDEIELWRFLRGRYGNHVSVERVLSGNGLGDLYTYARGAIGDSEPAWLTAKLTTGDRNAAVADAGLAGRDAACARALEMFAAILGAECGNLALRTLAVGGVVIGGGIPPKILPALQTGATRARFNDKGRFAAWTRTLPVRVALEPRAALLGAAHHAATLSTSATASAT